MISKIALGALIVFALLLVGLGLRPPSHEDGFDLHRLGALPVQEQGRIKPLDTVARNSLLLLRGKTNLRFEDGEEEIRLSAVEWFTDHAFRPEVADAYPVFRIDHPQVLDLLGLPRTEKYFAFNQLAPQLTVIQAAVERLTPEVQLRDAYQQEIAKLSLALGTYQSLRLALTPGTNLNDLPREYAAYVNAMGAGAAAIQSKLAGDDFDQLAHDRFVAFGNRYAEMAQRSELGMVPVDSSDPAVPPVWLNVGQSLLDAIRLNGIHPVVGHYTYLSQAYRQNDAAIFNEQLTELEAVLSGYSSTVPEKMAFESFFNQFDPFLRAEVLYVLVFLLAAASWIIWPKTLGSAAFWILVLGFLVHTFGLIARMQILDRPPVINLYSSAVFVGWGVVLFAFLLERILRNGIATATAALSGFATLLIASGLELQQKGDTMEAMRAVLDSNFWLATHVIIITIGYSAMFLAGTLGLFYILMGLASRKLDTPTALRLDGTIYGVTCFGLLLSFVGTMLGGVWADQSWGRFWGWDPKENGALMIVLWGAIMLHARWGKLVTRRGFATLAVGGNIITSWSWFGTNMLGIGLHSYGFMDAAFLWLMGFIISQLFFIIIGTLPPRFWRSPGALPQRLRESS